MGAGAADFRPGIGAGALNTFIGQPFPDAESLYNYSPYNNWASKVPSPLTTKSFPWSVNTLSSVVPTASHHHHHSQVNPVNCFNSATSLAGSHVGGMSVSVGQAASSMIPGMGSSLGVAGSPVAASGATCPYGPPAGPHPYGPPVYNPHHRTAAPSEPYTVTSSSLATLRRKAKEHSSGYCTSFITGVSNVTNTGSVSPVSSRASSGGGLSACQYALTSGATNAHSPGPEHANSTARAQVWGEVGAATSPQHRVVVSTTANSLGNSQVVGGTTQNEDPLREPEWHRPRSVTSPALSSTPSSMASPQHYMVYDEEGTTTDHKMEEDRLDLGNDTGTGSGSTNLGSGIGVGLGIGVGGSGTYTGGGFAGYWQHSTTTGYLPLFDWASNSIAAGSQSLSFPKDENRGQWEDSVDVRSDWMG